MITTLAGLTIGVSTSTPSSYTMSGYGALTYSNIGYLSERGEYGIEYEIIKFNPMSTRATIKVKGTFDYGSTELQLAYDPTDVGTGILKNGVNSFDDYSFVITYQDSVVEYFTAKVKSVVRPNGAANSMRMLSVALDVTNLVDTDDEAYIVSGSDRLLASIGNYLITA